MGALAPATRGHPLAVPSRPFVPTRFRSSASSSDNEALPASRFSVLTRPTLRPVRGGDASHESAMSLSSSSVPPQTKSAEDEIAAAAAVADSPALQSSLNTARQLAPRRLTDDLMLSTRARLAQRPQLLEPQHAHEEAAAYSFVSEFALTRALQKELRAAASSRASAAAARSTSTSSSSSSSASASATATAPSSSSSSSSS